jgi:hypothetical protein
VWSTQSRHSSKKLSIAANPLLAFGLRLDEKQAVQSTLLPERAERFSSLIKDLGHSSLESAEA